MTGLPAAGQPDVRDRSGWGYLPVLALVAGAGLLCLSISYTLAAQGVPAGQVLFWVAFLVMAAPITLRLGSAGAALPERLGLIAVLGVVLYIASVLRSPASFTGYDELLHFRSLGDILASGRLFEPNPLLTVSPLFPGLEIPTAAIVQVSGADPFVAATVLLGLVRLVFVFALFALYVEASGSERVAGLASAIYMLNPNFSFFDTQFAYESLAMPLVPVILLTVAVRARRADSRRWLTVAIVLTGLALVVTHHVTTYITAAILAGWLVVHFLRRRHDRYRAAAIWIGFLTVALGGGVWLVLVANETLPYLGGPLLAAAQELAKLILSGAARVPFESATGQVAPVWERLVGLGTAAILTAAIPVGLIAVVRKHRQSSLALGLGALSLGYPASLLGRLLPTGSEAAGRSLAVIFLGLSFVAALAALQLLQLPSVLRASRRRTLRAVGALVSMQPLRVGWTAAFAASVAVMVLGGVVIGSAPATRFPGPYLVEADDRSIDDESLVAAQWVRSTLGPDQRVAADRVNRLLMGSYGEADVIFHGSTGVETWQLFLSPQVGPAEIERLAQGRIWYVVIDRRLSSSLPLIPYYYEEGEVFDGPHVQPINAAVLAKWDRVGGVDRVYDNGVIQVYRVEALADGG